MIKGKVILKVLKLIKNEKTDGGKADLISGNLDLIKQYVKDNEIKDKYIEAYEMLKEILLVEIREIGGKYYIKYYNREDGTYIDYELTDNEYEVLI